MLVEAAGDTCVPSCPICRGVEIPIGVPVSSLLSTKCTGLVSKAGGGILGSVSSLLRYLVHQMHRVGRQVSRWFLQWLQNPKTHYEFFRHSSIGDLFFRTSYETQ